MAKYKTNIKIYYAGGLFSTNVEGTVEDNVELYQNILTNKKVRVFTIESNNSTVIFNTNNVIQVEVSPNNKSIKENK